MRYVLYLLLFIAFAMEVHAVAADLFPDAVVWAYGTVMVSLLIKVEENERDND